MKYPKPDKPPIGTRIKKLPDQRPSGWRTELRNGEWVLVPTGYRKGKEDKALRPRVIVTPLRGE